MWKHCKKGPMVFVECDQLGWNGKPCESLGQEGFDEIGVCKELEEECERIYWRTWDGGGGVANFRDKCVFVG